MQTQISPSHVAVLVPSVKKAAEYLRQYQFEIGEVDDFEETREIYIQGSEKNSLLLMEPKETGSYKEALQKRGPGIHHLAIDVLDVDQFLASISSSGWLLHLNSLKTLQSSRTAYLARPGFPALIEVQEKKKIADGPLFVSEVAFKIDGAQSKLVQAVGLEDIVKPSIGASHLILQGRSIELKNLF